MSKDNVFDAIKIALVVGSILSLINQYDVIIKWNLSNKDLLRIFLNYLVPFCVASISRRMYVRREGRRAA